MPDITVVYIPGIKYAVASIIYSKLGFICYVDFYEFLLLVHYLVALCNESQSLFYSFIQLVS